MPQAQGVTSLQNEPWQSGRDSCLPNPEVENKMKDPLQKPTRRRGLIMAERETPGSAVRKEAWGETLCNTPCGSKVYFPNHTNHHQRLLEMTLSEQGKKNQMQPRGLLVLRRALVLGQPPELPADEAEHSPATGNLGALACG